VFSFITFNQYIPTQETAFYSHDALTVTDIFSHSVLIISLNINSWESLSFVYNFK